MIARWLLVASLALTACDGMPQDQSGTLERVRAERVYRVGLPAGMQEDGHDLLQRLSAATGARPAVETGSFERLLTRLEEGELDLVVGEIEKTSPWSKRVTFVKPPLATTQGKPAPELELSAIARNGENGWIALVHEQAKAAVAR